MINNNILNTGNSPSITTGTFASRGNASDYTYGSFYSSIDTAQWSQSDGTNWIDFSGGGNINPTSNFMPVNNAGTFVDSSVENVINTYWQTFFQTGANAEGIYLDFLNRAYYLGDFNNNNQNALFYVDVNNSVIGTQWQSNSIGINFDFNSNTYLFGDFQQYNNGTSIAIYDTTQTIISLNQGNGNGLSLDFPNGIYKLGNFVSVNGIVITDNTFESYLNGNSKGINFNGTSNVYQFGDITLKSVYFEISYDDKLFQTYYDTNKDGLFFDFNTSNYYIGDFNNLTNGMKLQIDNGNKQAFFNDSGTKNFGVDFSNDRLTASTDLITTSAGSNSSQHLKIYIGGIEYKIQLKNP